MKPLSLKWMRLKHSAYYAVAPAQARKPGDRYLITRLAYHGPVKWELFAVAANGTREPLDTFVTLKEAKASASDFAFWNMPNRIGE